MPERRGTKLRYGPPRFAEEGETVELTKSKKSGGPFPSDARIKELFRSCGQGQILILERKERLSIKIIFPPGTDQTARMKFLVAVATEIDAPRVAARKLYQEEWSRKERART